MKTFIIIAAAVFLAGFSLSGCGRTANEKGIRYVATIAPVAYILQEIVGERGTVEILLPAGASPHTYNYKTSDAQKVADATAFVYVGGGLDDWAAGLEARRKIVLIDLVPKELLLPVSEGEKEEHGSGYNPHIWLDPIIVRDILPALVAQLSAADPGGKEIYEANAKKFAERLTELDSQVRTIVKPVEGRPVFQFHPGFDYFLKRYGLKIAGYIEPFPGDEPRARQLAKDVIEKIKSEGAKAVFKEPQLPGNIADLVAEEAGVKVYVLDYLGGSDGLQTYSDIILYNAKVLAEALK